MDQNNLTESFLISKHCGSSVVPPLCCLWFAVAFEYLEGGLVVVVLDVLVGSSEQQHSCAAVLQTESL